MRISTIVLSSVGLAAVCSAAAVSITPRARAYEYESANPSIAAEEDAEEEAGDAKKEPAAVIPGTYDQFIAMGGNRIEAAPMLPSAGPAEAIKANGTVKVKKRKVHGKDGRYTESGMQYPYSALGRISMRYTKNGRKKKSWCSGSLVGPRLVSTARHCVKPGGVYTFAPAYFAGYRFAPAAVTHVLHIDGKKGNGTCGYADDWAVFVVDRDLSRTNGYLGVKAYSDELLDREIWWTYGYPQDRNRTGQFPYVNHNFEVFKPKGCQRVRAAPLLHMADSSPGQSGSAIWLEPDAQGRRYQYGVHVASNKAHGIMSASPAWLNAIVAARKKFA